MEIANTAPYPKRNFGLVLTRFKKSFRFADAGFFINFLVVYIFAFISLYPKYGLSIIALMPLIVVTAGWFWGVKGGFLGGLFSFPLYTLLSIIVHETAWDTRFWIAGFICSAASLLLGTWVGHLCELGEHLKKEAEEREKMHEDLKETNNQLIEFQDTLEDKINSKIEEIRDKDHIIIKQSKEAALGKMIGNIAHQWRQPLSAVAAIIQSYEDAFEDGVLDQNYIEEKTDLIMGILQRMSRTIDDFRSFFKPNKNQQEFNLKKNIEKTITFASRSFENNNIKLISDLADDCVIFGFPGEFSHVILNIFNNAKDALVENKIEYPEITITLTKENDKSVIVITDNAGGISDEVIDSIFDPYFSTKEQGKGIGLGLYMSKITIEKSMNGKLTVRNIDGKAEFRVEV